MDITVQKAISASRNYEKQLSLQLSAPNVSYAQLEETLKEICQACTTALLQDFESATTQHAESRLWDSHQKVNNFYRAELQKLKKLTEANTVARRKLESSYLKSIKTAQKFYRGYIHSLASVYGGIAELERVARKVPFDGKVNPAQTSHKADSRNLLASCHATLIHLGDLSRYRETELTEKEKDWRPAVGFYDLAISVLPSSGMSYNQLAVIALADGNLFRAIYQLYRALSTEDPHPQAEANLRRAFFKVTAAWKAGELKMNAAMTAGAGLPSPMIAWYLRVLSLYYHGKLFPERDEMENEVVNQLKVDLNKRPTEGPPHRLVKINIAAGYAAQERLLKTESSAEDFMQSYLFFLRLNVRTFLALIQAVSEELQELELEKFSSQELNVKVLSDRITLKMRRILPVMRLYSLWLNKNVAVLTKGLDPGFSELQEELWTAYAKVLSSIIQAFPSEHLSSVEYLLEEDEDTIGFKPLHCEENRDFWYGATSVKPRWYEIAGKTRDASAEMISRVTGILVIGLKLAMDQACPLILDRDSCTFRNQSSENVLIHTETSRQTRDLSTDFPSTIHASSGLQQNTPSDPAAIREPEDDSFNSDAEAQRMVDSIVGIEETPADFTKSNNSTRIVSSTDFSAEISGVNTSSPFPVGTHTANDLIEAVRNYSQTHRQTPRKSSETRSTIASFPGLGVYSTGSPGLQSPLAAPQSYTSPGLAMVLPDCIPTSQQSVPKPKLDVAAATQLLVAPHGPSSHSRMNSKDSNSSALVPDATWSSYQPTENFGPIAKHPQRRSLYNDRGLGNGTFGDLMYRRESNHDSRGGSLVGSPSLSTTKNDPWARASVGLGSTTLLPDSGLAGQWQTPGWNIQSPAWGTASGSATPSGRNASRDYSYTRPVT